MINFQFVVFNILVKKTCLDTSLAGQMLFLKRNIRLMEVFPKEWEKLRNKFISLVFFKCNKKLKIL